MEQRTANTSAKIANNTFFLYIRMFILLGITLYTSRVVLNVLGISDFGIYNVVAGIVTMISFFNSAMSSATQRYLSYDIGLGDSEQLNKTFSSTLTIHLFIAILGFILCETLGLWYINNVLVFPSERIMAVNYVYQFSVLTFLISIIQVPYNALIIAREKMNMFAYISILEAILKLLAVFYLSYSKNDKLITYSFLIFLSSILLFLLYHIYSRKLFQESKYKFYRDFSYYRILISYSVWNLFGNIASVAKGQGVNIVLNIFYGTIVNASYAISNQVLNAINVFVINLQLAINPQIIKNYAQGEVKNTHQLILQGSKFSFFLVLLLVTPIMLNTEFILKTWLNDVPLYTNIFVRLVLLNILIDCLSGVLMTGAQATGRIKWYQIVVGGLIFMNLPLSYIILRLGFEAYYIYYISIFISLVSINFRLFFLKKVMNFSMKTYYKEVLSKVVILSSLALILLYIIDTYLKYDVNWFVFIAQSLCVIGLMMVFIIYLGLNARERKLILNFLLRR